MRVLLSTALALATLLTSAAAARAHPAPFSYLDLHVGSDALDAALVVHVFDVAHDLKIADEKLLLQPEFLADKRADIIALLEKRLVVQADGGVVRFEWRELAPAPDRHGVRLTLRGAVSSRPGALSVLASPFPYDPVHQTFVNVYERDALRQQAILDASHARFEYFTGGLAGSTAMLGRYASAGARQLLINPGHLVFILGLLLLAGGAGGAAWAAGAFAAGQLATFLVSCLGFASIPMSVIEPAIALSVVYIGIDNLMLGENGAVGRVWTAFGFGLAHGFGFSSAWRDIAAASQSLSWSIISFELGVLFGLSVVLLGTQLLVSAAKLRSASFVRRLIAAASAAVLVVGAYSFIAQVFLKGASS